MFPGIDSTKAQTLFNYLGRATTRMIERDYVRRELETQIRKLRSIGNKNFKGQMIELERKISAAMELERKLAGHQSEEDLFHRKLRDKIELLEKRLGTFLENREARTERIHELEKKILEKLADKTQKVAMLRADIEKLERMHGDLEKTGKFKKKLAVIDDRLKQLKSRLKALEAS